MWRDYKNNIVQNIFGCMERSEFAPYICPECGQRAVHLYMQVHDPNTRRGGLWIWCSSCRHFFAQFSLYPIKLEQFCRDRTGKIMRSSGVFRRIED